MNVHDKTEKTATIAVKVDKEASKNALIEFVGKYNQAVAKINVLSQNKPEIINELDYLTDDEKEKLTEQLGIFSTDFSLTNIKSNMQTIISSNYKFEENLELLQMLLVFQVRIHKASFEVILKLTKKNLMKHLKIILMILKIFLVTTQTEI